jgi:hypothetical protein
MGANLDTQRDSFYREYTSREAIAKYTRATAGAGINSLLDREYKQVYLDTLQFLPSEMGPSLSRSWNLAAADNPDSGA